MDITVNYTAVLLSAIAAFVLGFLWHGPLFGKQWMKLSGISEHEMREMQAKGMASMWKTMVAAFIALLVMGYVLAHFATAFNISTVTGAVQLAFWIWLGFIATVLLNGVLWEKRKVDLYLFNVVYQLVSLVVMSLIVGLWK